MINFMSRKLNKKGFTLAELLIVVAIIAILVAIAVPIFTNSLREAQLRTNQANARTVKVAGVNYVLANWNGVDSANANKMSSGAQEGYGWMVTANVDKNGDISGLKVNVVNFNNVADKTSKIGDKDVNESSGMAPDYVVTVYLTDADLTA